MMNMFTTKVFFAIAALALLLAGRPASATPYDTLQSIAGTYNVFLLGNLGTASAPYTADSQGPVAVAGNAYFNNVGVDTNSAGSAALIVGGNLSQTGGADGGNVFVGGNASISGGGGINNLTVGGSLTQSGGNLSGNVFVGGAAANLSGGVTISGSLSVTGANSSLNASSNGGSSPSNIYVTASTQVNDPSYWTTPKTSGGPTTPTAPLDVFGSATDIQNASTALAAAAATQTVNFSGGTLNITLTGNGSNIIDLNVPNGTNITGINITNAAGVTPTGVIINVNGNNLSFSGGFSSSLGASQVLFNFSNATTVALSGIGFNASLLAPLATVNFSSGDIDGALIANNFTGTAQFNSDGGFNDPLPTYAAPGGSQLATTPEPASLAIFGVGLIGLALIARRRMLGARTRTRITTWAS
jgi:choice-of-anchor A domain-containing protein